MATMTALSTVTVGSATTSITFSSIPQLYTDLCIVVSGRSDFAAYYGGGTIRFNGDTGSNYSFRRLYGDTSVGSTAATSTGIENWDVNGAPTTANTFGNTQFYIPNYTSSSYKSCSIDYSVENNSADGINGIVAGLWSNTSAITSVTLLSFTFSTYYFQPNTTATLYGVWNGPETLPSTPTIGTATATGDTTATVAFTPTSATNVDVNYTALSSPGSITATGTSSPITVSGLTGSTAYTFQVRANNPGGSSDYSAASNSVTTLAPAPYESIASIILGSNTEAVTFSSIPQTFKHLQLRWFGGTVGGNYMFVRTNLGNGGTQGRITNYGLIYYNNSSVSQDATYGCELHQGGIDSTIPAAGVIDILEYSSTTKGKIGTSRCARPFTPDYQYTVNNYVYFTCGTSTAAVTSVTLSGNASYPLATYTEVALYGIRG